MYDAIDDISGLLGGPPSSSIDPGSNTLFSLDSITGGVGTTFYMAPEQERNKLLRSKYGEGSYDSKADVFSLGVLLFEMFMPPFATYMERADVLIRLRGDKRFAKADDVSDKKMMVPLFTKEGVAIGNWEAIAKQRFPENFLSYVPENAQKIILWCLERSPEHRPSAKQLLTCGLLPRKVELEQRYLDEVLQTLSNPQSEQSYQQILSKLFQRPTPKVNHLMYTSCRLVTPY